MSEGLPRKFDRSFYLRSVNLELTSRCNLRCTYCSVSQATYVAKVMPREAVTEAVRGIGRLRVTDVALNGHGETTTLEGWTDVASAIRRGGARVHLTSNFARVFTPDEVDELAAMSSVVVSLDTDDAELLRRVRRGARLDVILENARKVREAAAGRHLRGPVLTVSCVVGAHNVMHLDRLVRFCLAHGFRGFDFCNLVRYPDLPGVLNVDHVTTLPPGELRAARDKILQARGVAFSKGASCEIQSGLLDAIDLTLAGGGDGTQEALGRQRRRFAPPGEGETRLCLDPWRFALIRSDGAVHPCCWMPPVRTLAEAPLEAILNTPPMVALRRQLLSGDLGPSCRTCPARPVAGLAEFHAFVRRRVPASPVAASVLRLALTAKSALDPAGRLGRRLLGLAG